MQTVNSIKDILAWENVATNSRYGLYASEIEGRAVLKALSLAERPSVGLDIGCEGGRWTRLFTNAGWEMICTDIAQQSLDICKKRIPEATCIQVNPDDTRLPVETDSLGIVLCIEVMPVIHADWFIDETFRVLRRGGLLVGVMWNRSSWRGLIYHSIPALRTVHNGRRSSGWYPLSYPAWRERFCQQGFSMLYEEGYAWIPYRRNSNASSVPIATQIEHFFGLRKLVNLSPMIAFVAQKC